MVRDTLRWQSSVCAGVVATTVASRSQSTNSVLHIFAQTPSGVNLSRAALQVGTHAVDIFVAPPESRAISLLFPLLILPGEGAGPGQREVLGIEPELITLVHPPLEQVGEVDAGLHLRLVLPEPDELPGRCSLVPPRTSAIIHMTPDTALDADVLQHAERGDGAHALASSMASASAIRTTTSRPVLSRRPLGAVGSLSFVAPGLLLRRTLGSLLSRRPGLPYLRVLSVPSFVF